MSCCKCYLLDINCLRDYTKITNERGVTFDHIKKEIILSHEVDLIPLIGQQCYDELCAAKEADTLTSNQITLIDVYITPFLAFVVEWYYLNANVQYTAAGSVLRAGVDFAQPSSKQIQNAAEITRRNIDFYKDRLIKYLTDNNELFPCFVIDPCDPNNNNNNSFNNIVPVS